MMGFAWLGVMFAIMHASVELASMGPLGSLFKVAGIVLFFGSPYLAWVVVISVAYGFEALSRR